MGKANGLDVIASFKMWYNGNAKNYQVKKGYDQYQAML
jgi:hypothetical protein